MERARLDAARDDFLARFADLGSEVVSQFELDYYSEDLPPRLVGTGQFALEEMDDEWGSPAYPFQVVVDENARLEVDGEEVSAQILVRARGKLHFHGLRLAVHAFDSARVEGNGMSTIHLHDQASARLSHAGVGAFGDARVEAVQGCGVSLFDRARCDAGTLIAIRALDQATVHLGCAGAPESVGRSNGIRSLTMVVAYDQAMILVTEASEPCVLIPVGDQVQVDTTKAPADWWQETWRLSEKAIRNDDLDPAHLDWLRAVRMASDPDFAAVERAGEWKPVPYRPKGKTVLGE